ncbi:MAG: hypothetical protein F6K04_21110 [Leptolyngbya sp. SIO4C5]|nr:hypothetical protein [Leptolyngbya sp. SIO4C5]
MRALVYCLRQDYANVPQPQPTNAHFIHGNLLTTGPPKIILVMSSAIASAIFFPQQRAFKVALASLPMRSKTLEIAVKAVFA